jgi:hypothetical protein
MEKDNYTDYLGFEIIGLREAKTKDEKICAWEAHLKQMELLYQESIDWIEKELYKLKR